MTKPPGQALLATDAPSSDLTDFGNPTRGQDAGGYLVGFLLVPGFSMLAFSAAIDPLREANRLAGKAIYRWRIYSVDGGPVATSIDISLPVDAAIGEKEQPDLAIVIAGFQAEQVRDKATLSWLRRLARSGKRIGAVSTGTYVLAHAGLLTGRRCTTHWENAGALAERFPDIDVVNEIVVVDEPFYTSAGGAAAFDMMLHLIAAQHGRALAMRTSEMFIYPSMREQTDKQRLAIQGRYGISNAKLISAVEAMEEAVEEPVDLKTLASRTGTSVRQLERLFARYLGTSPNRFYLDLRLARGRALLLQTARPVIEIALACGFVSASHFSKCYKQKFDRRPSDERRKALLEIGAGGRAR